MFVAISVYALLQIQHAVALYVGCFDREAVMQNTAGVYLYNGENPPSVDCDCRAINYDYSYTYGMYGGVGIYETCFCTNAAPSYSYFLANDYGCDAGIADYGDAAAFLVSPETDGWTQGFRCYTPSTPITGISVTSAEQCLVHCQSQSLSFAALVVHEEIPSATCGCYATAALWQSLPTTVCTYETWQIFSHTPQPSALPRRQLEIMKNRYGDNLCPAGATACFMNKDSKGRFECVDTSSELESCGGCNGGELGPEPNKNTTGLDCTTLPGVSVKGVTCYEGKCIAFACEDGFALVNESCVPQTF